MVLGRQDTREAERPRLGEADLAEICQVGQTRVLRKAQSLYVGGETGSSAILVKAGRLKLSRLSAEGKELILSLLEPGDLLPLAGERVCGRSEPLVEALEPAVLVVVRQRDFEWFVQTRPDLALAVIRQLTARVRELEERIEEMVFKDIPRRLATTLLRLAAVYGAPEPGGGTAVGIRVTQQELANLIGASREMVNHALSAWRREGLIELHGRCIVIRRADALEALESAR